MIRFVWLYILPKASVSGKAMALNMIPIVLYLERLRIHSRTVVSWKCNNLVK